MAVPPSQRVCLTCQHPDRAEIDAALRAGDTVKSVAVKHAYPSLGSLYRHNRAGHHLAIKQPTDSLAAQSPQQAFISPVISATLRDVSALVREAKAHLREAREGDDLKAINGAITAAAKALELAGKLRGELQAGAQVNVSITAEAKVALDLHAAAVGLSQNETTDQARAWLSAQLEAGDEVAVRTVLDLVRLIPSAEVGEAGGDATTQPQRLTGAPMPDAESVTGDVLR